jgi:hypothetical protein
LTIDNLRPRDISFIVELTPGSFDRRKTRLVHRESLLLSPPFPAGHWRSMLDLPLPFLNARAPMSRLDTTDLSPI